MRKGNFVTYTDSKGPDQPTHLGSLISAFTIRLQNLPELWNIHVGMV